MILSWLYRKDGSISNEILPGYSSDATDQDENEDALQPPEAKRRMKGLKYEYIYVQ